MPVKIELANWGQECALFPPEELPGTAPEESN